MRYLRLQAIGSKEKESIITKYKSFGYTLIGVDAELRGNVYLYTIYLGRE